jgi:hypothetical protein
MTDITEPTEPTGAEGLRAALAEPDRWEALGPATKTWEPYGHWDKFRFDYLIRCKWRRISNIEPVSTQVALERQLRDMTNERAKISEDCHKLADANHSLSLQLYEQSETIATMRDAMGIALTRFLASGDQVADAINWISSALNRTKK